MDLIVVDLDPVERDFLQTGLLQWGGVVAMTDDLAKALGHNGAQSFYADSAHCADNIDAGLGLTAGEWRRCLGACEVAFSSEILGLGHQWEDFSDFDPDDSYLAMRRLQWKIGNLGT